MVYILITRTALLHYTLCYKNQTLINNATFQEATSNLGLVIINTLENCSEQLIAVLEK